MFGKCSYDFYQGMQTGCLSGTASCLASAFLEPGYCFRSSDHWSKNSLCIFWHGASWTKRRKNRAMVERWDVVQDFLSNKQSLLTKVESGDFYKQYKANLTLLSQLTAIWRQIFWNCVIISPHVLAKIVPMISSAVFFSSAIWWIVVFILFPDIQVCLFMKPWSKWQMMRL